MLRTLALVAFLATVGCTSYASQRLVEPSAAADKAPQIFGVLEGREFAKRVQVKLPAELVVGEVLGRSEGPRVPKEDKRTAQLLDAVGQDRATFSNVEPLFTEVASGEFTEWRQAAARHHADLMLVVSASEKVEDRTGVATLLNALILPCFLVPTQRDDLALHVRAAVVDVRNDLVYATFEDHREETVRATSAGERDAVEEAFDKLYADSLAKLRTRVTERLRLLAAAPN